MPFALGPVLAGVPHGYQEAENARMRRMLEQQQFDTNLRQAPLRDDLLRAQAQHARMQRAAGQQQMQRYNDERAANTLLWNAINQPTPVTSSTPPIGPNGGPIGNAPPVPTMPPPGAGMPPPGAGMPMQGPQGLQGPPMQQPQGMPPQGMPQQGPQGMPQQGPINNAPPMPQPPQQDPYTQAYQSGLQNIQRRLAGMPGTPDQKMQAYQMEEQRLRQAIGLQRQGDVQRRQDALMEQRINSLEAQREYRQQQLELQGRRADEYERRGQAGDQYRDRRLTEQERHNQAGEANQQQGRESRENQAITRFRVSQAENEIRALANQGLLRRADADAIARKWGVSPDQLSSGQGGSSTQQKRKNPFGADVGDFKKLLDSKLTALHIKDPKNLPENFVPFTMEFNGKYYEATRLPNGEIDINPVDKPK